MAPRRLIEVGKCEVQGAAPLRGRRGNSERNGARRRTGGEELLRDVPLVEMGRLELPTPCLQSRCSPS
jgi:hypothetical protein